MKQKRKQVESPDQPITDTGEDQGTPVDTGQELASQAKKKEATERLIEGVKSRLYTTVTKAKETGDRLLLACALVEFKLFELCRDKETLIPTVARWISKLTLEDREVRGLASTMTDGVSRFIHKQMAWRQLRAGPEVVKKYVQNRIDLCERLKLAIPKEAHTWALARLKEQQDLSDWLPELYRSNGIWIMIRGLIENKDALLMPLSRQLMQHDDMEACSMEQFGDMVLQEPMVKTMLLTEVYAAMVQVYVTCYSLYWDYINMAAPQENAGMDGATGLCERSGHPDCDCDRCKAGESYKQTPVERIDWMDKLTGDAIARSPAWGGYGPFIGAIRELGLARSSVLLTELATSAQMVFEAAQELTEERRQTAIAKSDAHKDRKQAEKEKMALKAKIAELERQIDQMRQARAKRAAQEEEAGVATAPDVKGNGKVEEALRVELDKKARELDRTSELLRSLLSSKDTEADEPTRETTITLEEVKQKRGVIIGGHDNLTSKLRREMPNCTFYNPDVKMLDEDAVRNSEYIMFFTGYVNHCLTGHALRLARLHRIPCGYTDRTNVSLVMKDVQAVFT